jgi:hypothetical protein
MRRTAANSGIVVLGVRGDAWRCAPEVSRTVEPV